MGFWVCKTKCKSRTGNADHIRKGPGNGTKGARGKLGQNQDGQPVILTQTRTGNHDHIRKEAVEQIKHSAQIGHLS